MMKDEIDWESIGFDCRQPYLRVSLTSWARNFDIATLVNGY